MTTVREPKPAQPTVSRYNFATGVIDGVGWPLGMAFFSTTTLLPAFLLKLHASYLLIGLLPALINLGYLLPGILVAARISRMPVVRPYLFWLGIVERVPLFLIAALAYSVGTSRPTFLLVAFYALFLIHAVTLGFNQPAYWSVVGKLIPANRRGRMFGIAGLLGGILGIGVDPVTHFLLARAQPGTLDGYADCFLLAALLILVSFLPFAWLRERPGVPAMMDTHKGHYITDLKRVWRSDRGFRRLVMAQLAFAAWSCAPPFFLPAAVDRLHIGPELVALYTTVNVVSLAFGNLIWGALADKCGNKVVLIGASAVMIAGTAITLFGAGTVGYEYVFALTALGSGGVSIAGFNVVLEFAPNEAEMSYYLATMNALTAVPRAVAPIVGGLLATHVGFTPVFVLATVCGALTLLSSAAMAEPRRRAAE
ncbi:MAG TPA: MFS transporter [Capsulimonadaceae bacterium]